MIEKAKLEVTNWGQKARWKGINTNVLINSI